jgi:hypothetical protein
MRWSHIAARQPSLGAVAHDKLIRPGVLLVGTTRRDGTARISGIEPLVMDGGLWLSMMRGSTKAADLRRDSRILVHSVVADPNPDGEIMIRGTARLEADPRVQGRYSAAVVAADLGWEPEVGEFALFEVEVTDVTYIGYADDGAQHVVRWPADVEYLRPCLTATSLGPPEPVRRLLV